MDSANDQSLCIVCPIQRPLGSCVLFWSEMSGVSPFCCGWQEEGECLPPDWMLSWGRLTYEGSHIQNVEKISSQWKINSDGRNKPSIHNQWSMEEMENDLLYLWNFRINALVNMVLEICWSKVWQLRSVLCTVITGLWIYVTFLPQFSPLCNGVLPLPAWRVVMSRRSLSGPPSQLIINWLVIN